MKDVLISLRQFTSSILLSPSIWLYWFVVVFFIFLDFPFHIVFLFMLLFVLLFNFFPYLLIENLESRYQVAQEIKNECSTHILVLGGGHLPDDELLVEQQLNNGSLRRVLEGVRLANLHPNSLLIMSGQSIKSGHPSQAQIQAFVAMTMGIKKGSIEIIPEPHNTEQEAIYYFKKFNFHKNPIFLVTKALHQRRAAFIFSSFGYNIIPSPSYFVYKNFNPSLFWFLAPDFNLILHFGEYLKEIVGFNFLKLQIFLGWKSFPLKKFIVENGLRRGSFEVLNR